MPVVYKRMWTLILALLILTGCAHAREMNPAETSAEDWKAKAEAGFVLITDGAGREIARLEYETEEPTRPLLLAADYNFDGMTDLAALKNMGTVNGYYYVWLRKSDGGFERCRPMEEICSPAPNTSIRLLDSYERVDASEYRERQYIWKGNEPTLHRCRSISYQEADCVCVMEEIFTEYGKRVAMSNYSAAEWERLNDMERRAAMLATACFGEAETERFVRCEGKQAVDGETYYICPVKANYETMCVFYFPADETEPVLMDDVMDGQNQPRWLIMPDGNRMERS